MVALLGLVIGVSFGCIRQTVAKGIPVVLEAVALLTAPLRLSYIGLLCSWGLNGLSPRRNIKLLGYERMVAW